jgi:hypothetical protein
MSSEISKEQLRQVVAEDFERLLEEVVQAVNAARPGRIINQSEEPVREAAGRLMMWPRSGVRRSAPAN